MDKLGLGPIPNIPHWQSCFRVTMRWLAIILNLHQASVSIINQDHSTMISFERTRPSTISSPAGQVSISSGCQQPSTLYFVQCSDGNLFFSTVTKHHWLIGHSPCLAITSRYETSSTFISRFLAIITWLSIMVDSQLGETVDALLIWIPITKHC